MARPAHTYRAARRNALRMRGLLGSERTGAVGYWRANAPPSNRPRECARRLRQIAEGKLRI